MLDHVYTVLTIVYIGLATAIVVRTYFWTDLRAWWVNFRAARRERRRLNQMWEAGGSDA